MLYPGCDESDIPKDPGQSRAVGDHPGGCVGGSHCAASGALHLVQGGQTLLVISIHYFLDKQPQSSEQGI